MQNIIEDAVKDDVAIRTSFQLQPAGGKGSKVFPPRYMGEGNAAEYAFEERKMEDGRVAQCVLLDSVQSQANRMKRALLRARRNGELDIPIIKIDFASEFDDLDTVTHLEAPHGIADAMFVNGEIDGKPFRKSQYGRVLYEADKDNALELFKICPTALLFGFWDSRQEVGSGNSFQRNISSEIVGIDVEEGLNPAGRTTELGITGTEKNIYLDENGQVTYDEEEGVTGAKKPSSVGLGNIPPSAYEEGDKKPGGVTLDHAKLTSVITLSGLRTLSFGEGNSEDSDRNRVCRALLAALGMAGQALQHKRGYALRSRCTLVPQEDLTFEIVSRTGATEEIDAHTEDILEAFDELSDRAAEWGADWEFDELTLEPAEGIKKVIEQSQMQPGE